MEMKMDRGLNSAFGYWAHILKVESDAASQSQAYQSEIYTRTLVSQDYTELCLIKSCSTKVCGWSENQGKIRAASSQESAHCLLEFLQTVCGSDQGVTQARTKPSHPYGGDVQRGITKEELWEPK